MKKQIIIGLGLFASLVLLGAGCATAKRAEPANTNVNTNEAVNEAAEPAGEVKLEIQQEDLDKLKADINKMEYEDLNAFTK